MIVTGVMVALAANAWWSGTIDRRLAQDYRGRLAAELRENLAVVDQVLQHTDRVQAATDSLERFFETDATELPFDRALVNAYNATRRFARAFTASTFLDLTNTGNWRLLPDPDLRAELSGIYTRLSRYTQDWFGAEYRSAARRAIPIQLQMRVRDECPAISSPDWNGCPLAVDAQWATAAAARLRSDAELRGAYRLQAHEISIFVRDMTAVRASLEQVLEALEQ